MTVDVLLADVVQQRDLNEVEARALVDGMRRDVADLGERIATAYLGRAWLALGHASWDDLCDAEFDGARLRIPREQRAEQVQSLRSAGLSTRAIGSALGQSEATVRRDLRTASDDAVEHPATVQSLDGRTRPASQPPRPPSSPAPASTSGQMATAPGRDPIGAGEPTTAAEFIAQRATGQVLSPEDWQAQQERPPSLADLAARSPSTDPDAQIRARCSRDIAAIADLILVDPAEAARIAHARGVLPAWRLTFREHAKWAAAFEQALIPGLKAVR